MGSRMRDSLTRPSVRETDHDGPGGEGGSVFRNLFTSPSLLSEALPATGLLACSLVLSAILVGLVTITLIP
jgi:hypothetical protein